MHVMVVGNGGREAALAHKIFQSPLCSRLTVTGHNPSFPPDADIVLDAEDLAAEALKREVNLVVVGPEAPLAAGLADDLYKAGIPCFGPSRAAARLETSKAFAKEIMAHAGVPTASYLHVDREDPASVKEAERRCAVGSVVIKVDGLAAGKGVFVCQTPEEARAALDEAWSGRFGPAARRLLLEDLLTGPEVSIFALSDGERVVPLPAAQDHKRLGDGDTGPNTGGMGAYVPCPLVTDDDIDDILATVHQPVIDALAKRGTPYRGVLYAGLMLTPRGPMVLEFNVRFGDPECQPLMALWKDDILPWLYGAAAGALRDGRPDFEDGAACCVVLASAGYPASSTKGVRIPEPGAIDGVQVFHAAAKREPDGHLYTSGGRVLGVTGTGADIHAAREAAYRGVEACAFEGAQWRTDIAYQALEG